MGTDFQNMLHIAESTIGRRYAGWFIKNTERTQRIYDDLKNSPLPGNIKPAAQGEQGAKPAEGEGGKPQHKGGRGGQKVAWGGVKSG